MIRYAVIDDYYTYTKKVILGGHSGLVQKGGSGGLEAMIVSYICASVIDLCLMELFRCSPISEATVTQQTFKFCLTSLTGSLKYEAKQSLAILIVPTTTTEASFGILV